MKSNLTFGALPLGGAVRRERGFTMIEVMVTVFILCLGLLGVGSLQYLSIKSNQSALSRAIATEYAYQMLDYIRGFPGITMVEGSGLGDKCTSLPAEFCKPETFKFNTGVDGTPEFDSTPPNDIKEWIEDLVSQLREDLPGATMTVCPSDTADVRSVDFTNCEGATIFDKDSVNKFYAVIVQSEAEGNRVAASTDSADKQPLQVVVVGEVL